MEANLHLHSRYSDGTLWPERIAELAAAGGLALAALTDHDTLAGSARFAAAAEAHGMRTVPACEIDCIAPELDYRSELLAYFPHGSFDATAALLDGILEARTARLRRFIERSRVVFRRDDLSFEELVDRKLDGGEIAEGRAPSLEPLVGISYNKVDFFSYLKAKGAIGRSVGYREFGRAYFASGLIPQGRFPKPTVDEVVSAVRSDGGLVVLPHPGHQFGDDPSRVRRESARFYDFLSWFRSHGVSGVELYWYGDAARSEVIDTAVSGFAADLGLFVTYGSDCHGPGSEKHTLGLYSGDFGGFPEVSCPTV
jgi:hypothetical protein